MLPLAFRAIKACIVRIFAIVSGTRGLNASIAFTKNSSRRRDKTAFVSENNIAPDIGTSCRRSSSVVLRHG